MKKVIGYMGFIFTIALGSSLLLAAPGDAVFIGSPQSAVLDTGALKSAFMAAIRDSHAPIQRADVAGYKCSRYKIKGNGTAKRRNKFRCHGERFPDDLTDDEFFDLVMSGSVGPVSGQLSTTELKSEKIKNETNLAAFVSLAFSGTTLEDLALFECKDLGNDFSCEYYLVLSDTKANWRAAYENGQVTATIGEVVED